MKAFFCYVLLCSIVLYKIKYFVAERHRHNISLERQISDVDKEIRLLKADWAYVNTPKRLSKLAEERLKMTPIQANQIIEKGSYVH